MSKTTIFLFIILLLVIGCLVVIVNEKQQNPFIESLTKPLISRLIPARTELSFESDEQTVKEGQTVNVPVIIHDADTHPDLVQIELSYDPTVMTIDTVSPGAFFDKPAIALDDIDPVAGRISFALRCPADATSDCVNSSSSTVATLTVTINPYVTQTTTKLSFLPKTVVRTRNGRDLLEKTNGIQLMITQPALPVASSSAPLLPAGNLIHITPVH